MHKYNILRLFCDNLSIALFILSLFPERLHAHGEGGHFGERGQIPAGHALHQEQRPHACSGHLPRALPTRLRAVRAGSHASHVATVRRQRTRHAIALALPQL